MEELAYSNNDSVTIYLPINSRIHIINNDNYIPYETRLIAMAIILSQFKYNMNSKIHKELLDWINKSEDINDSHYIIYCESHNNLPILEMKQGEKLSWDNFVGGDEIDETLDWYLNKYVYTSNDNFQDIYISEKGLIKGSLIIERVKNIRILSKAIKFLVQSLDNLDRSHRLLLIAWVIFSSKTRINIYFLNKLKEWILKGENSSNDTIKVDITDIKGATSLILRNNDINIPTTIKYGIKNFRDLMKSIEILNSQSINLVNSINIYGNNN